MGAHKTAQFIPDLIAKFLNFQAFIKTASPLTLKAYELDLTQAYGLQSIGKFLRPGDWDLKQTALNPSFKSKNAPIEASVEYRFRAASGPQATRDARLNPKIRSSARIRPKSVARLDSGSISSYYLSSDAELLKLSREAQTRWAQLSSASRNRKAACLKSFLHFLYQEGEIETDLGLQIHTPKVAVRMPNFLSVDEALALIKSIEAAEKKAADEDSLAQARRDLALILLLYGGGLRVSEACALRWQDIDANRRILKVKGKGGKERLVALPPPVLRAVSKLQSGGGRFVWGKEALDTRKAFEIVRTWGRRAGLLKPLHPHALRHSFATHLLTGGTNLRTLQELLGHKSLQATQKYTHIGIDQLARTIESHHPLGDTQRLKAKTVKGRRK